LVWKKITKKETDHWNEKRRNAKLTVGRAKIMRKGNEEGVQRNGSRKQIQTQKKCQKNFLLRLSVGQHKEDSRAMQIGKTVDNTIVRVKWTKLR